MLSLRSISKKLGTFEMSDISFDIAPGQYCMLLGPSGVGKTVLIETIAGLITPDSGSILWEQKDITQAASEKRNFAVVYQDYCLFPHLSVADNIGYGPKTGGADKKTIQTKLRSIAQTLGITELLDRKPSTLSGGQQQRTALARALICEPKLLLLDEPLAALDTKTRLDLRKQLKQLAKDLNIGVLHVTHDPLEAIALGDVIVVMIDSKIKQIATPRELFRTPSDSQVADFLGMDNVFKADFAGDGLVKVGAIDVYASAAGDATCNIWIKPEEILLSSKPFDSSARNQFETCVVSVEHKDPLIAVKLGIGDFELTAFVTYGSFEHLQIEKGSAVYATFKSSAVHCF
ncbi:MAG: ATP-binding cassette domain-containing protein [Planctomycetes bacterium]|nr:ATP-binding cassette domain-containing protein [Planctomycetota bacterium]